jgi:hypothetical protein
MWHPRIGGCKTPVLHVIFIEFNLISLCKLSFTQRQTYIHTNRRTITKQIFTKIKNLSSFTHIANIAQNISTHLSKKKNIYLRTYKKSNLSILGLIEKLERKPKTLIFLPCLSHFPLFSQHPNREQQHSSYSNTRSEPQTLP